jgi:hypothetical protein
VEPYLRLHEAVSFGFVCNALLSPFSRKLNIEITWMRVVVEYHHGKCYIIFEILTRWFHAALSVFKRTGLFGYWRNSPFTITWYLIIKYHRNFYEPLLTYGHLTRWRPLNMMEPPLIVTCHTGTVERCAAEGRVFCLASASYVSSPIRLSCERETVALSTEVWEAGRYATGCAVHVFREREIVVTWSKLLCGQNLKNILLKAVCFVYEMG